MQVQRIQSYNTSFGAIILRDNRSFSKDLLMPLVSERLGNIEAIARYMKEMKGDFNKPNKNELLQVVNQLAINEQNRKAKQR